MAHYHMTVDLVGGLQLSDRELESMLKNDDGSKLAAHEIRSQFVALLRQGYDVLPMCDNCDEKGHCK